MPATVSLPAVSGADERRTVAGGWGAGVVCFLRSRLSPCKAVYSFLQPLQAFFCFSLEAIQASVTWKGDTCSGGGRAKPAKAIYKPGESVLLRGCSGVASRLSPWVSLVHPLYIPYLSLVHPFSLLGHSGDATAPLPGRRVRLARDHHGELRWKRRSPAIHLLPGTDKDARTRREVTHSRPGAPREGWGCPRADSLGPVLDTRPPMLSQGPDEKEREVV